MSDPLIAPPEGQDQRNRKVGPEPRQEVGAHQSSGAFAFSPRAWPAQVKLLAALIVLLAIVFAKPLYDLARYAMHSDLYSHILLIPFISLYLVWLKRANLEFDSKADGRLAVIPLLAAVGILMAFWRSARSGWQPAREDYLAAMTLSFLGFFLACTCAVLGKRTLRAIAFPLAFLIFIVPFPEFMRRGIESLLQHGSAQAAFLLLNLSGMPVFRQGTQFQLPGFSMEVAPECSGIHSSLVLFISSLLAGHLLLRSPWARAILVLAILPLALLRNGFRIFILAQLCVRVNPDWINSDLHHRGGPIYFVLSLLPLLLLLFLLTKWERKKIQSKV